MSWVRWESKQIKGGWLRGHPLLPKPYKNLQTQENKLEGNWLDQKVDGDLMGEPEIRCCLLTVSGDSSRSLQGQNTQDASEDELNNF